MGHTVMIVDDSFVVRQQVASALRGADIGVIEATDGFDAIQKLAATTDVGLVICDVNMPRMDGFEFLETVRGGDVHSGVPVVMLTTEGQQSLRARARALGVKGWIVKPFHADHLVETARKLTHGAPRG